MCFWCWKRKQDDRDPPYGANEGQELTSASTEPTRASQNTGTRASRNTGSRQNSTRRKRFSFLRQKRRRDPPNVAKVGPDTTSVATELTRVPRESGSPQGFTGLMKKKVAIFSRDSEENYRWLQDVLQSKRFKEHVKCSDPVYISNSFAEFRKEVLYCNVAILYHTKKRGRINITNVTDSLYDDELKFLHDRLGKKKVVVLIDDLERSDEETKRKIMEGQKDLGRLSGEVLLFTQQDKHLIIYGRSEDSKVEEKLKILKKIIK